MDDEFFGKALELSASNTPFATATVVRAEKPTSGKPGDKAIITLDGTLYGWIGGSCAQPTVIREAQIALREGKPRFIRLSSENDPASVRDGLMELPMTCYSEGVLEIFIEPQLPQPRLMVVGNMPVARALMQIGQVMQYDVVAIDPEQSTTPLPHAKLVINQLGTIAEHVHTSTFVVVASHGNYDEAALEHVLRAHPRYVGLVASRKRFESVVEYLKTQGLTGDDLAPLKAPAGLDIQAQRADEIALSIMAEIVQRRRAAPEPLHNKTFIGDIPLTAVGAAETETAIDPVCGMTVVKAKAKASYEYSGTTYYFCCNGCKTAFARNPQDYLHVEHGA
jgi:xanthine dehydrogenase accessory factor